MSIRSRILSAFVRRPVKLAPSDWTFVKFYFGQYGEDAVFLAFWDWKKRKTGYYVDVGAYHPIDLSNTNVLYRHGWRGLTIDPNPKMAPLFARHRPDGTHVVCAVGEKESTATYYSFKQANYNTLTDSDADLPPHLIKEGQAFEKMTVPVRPLAAILREHGPRDGKIDLLNVDCEGMDAVVLGSNDWTRFRPEFIMVEDPSPQEDSASAHLLKEQGYQLISWVQITKLYRRRDAAPSTP
jgi:FkbM family methyltransferase